MPMCVHPSGQCDDAPMVEVSRDYDAVVMRMSPQEAELLSFALRAGYETTSRAEYWIRHGVAQPSVRALHAAVYAVYRSTDLIRVRARTRRRGPGGPQAPAPAVIGPLAHAAVRAS